MLKQPYSLPPIADFLSLPGQELIDHALKNRLTESPGLILHSLLCRIVSYALAKKLPDNLVDMDTLLSLGLVSHSTRVIADEGLKGNHADPTINTYMKDHSNLNLAYEDAKREGLSKGILQGLLHFDGNPATRVGYFPHEVMALSDGDINWTETLYQIASWSIAGGITTLDKRFDDLRARRSEDIGRLELAYIQDKVQQNEVYDIPDPILDEASKDLGYDIDSKALQTMIISGTNGFDSRKIGELVLNSYQTWAISVRQQYCELTGVTDFDVFLRTLVDTMEDSDIKNNIKKSFESAIGRSLRDDEFFPAIPGIELIYKRIGAMKVNTTQEMAKVRVERLMGNIDRVTRPFISHNSD